MLNQQAAGVVETIVNDFVQKGKQFTAYDVTVAAREDAGTKVRRDKVFHTDVRTFVNDFFANGSFPFNYNRTLTTLKSGVEAFVYHIDSQSSQDYVNQLNGVAVISNPVQAVAAPAPVQTDETIQRATDSRGRITVPAKFVRALGLKTGDTAYIEVIVTGDSIIITANESILNGVDSTHTVDRDGNIRLSEQLINRVGGVLFDITLDIGIPEIIVSAS